jgi:hypothetical protein
MIFSLSLNECTKVATRQAWQEISRRDKVKEYKMVNEKDGNKNIMKSRTPIAKCEGIASSFQDEPNQTIPAVIFIQHCVDNGYSVGQVLKSIINRTLVMLSKEGKRVHPFSYLSEKNLESFINETKISFPVLHADFFWRQTRPDHMGGWGVQAEENPIASSIQKDSAEYERAKSRTIPEQKDLAKQKKKEGKTSWEIAQSLFPHEVKKVEEGRIKKESLLRKVRHRLEF